MTMTGQSNWLEASADMVQRLSWPAIGSWLVVHASKVQASVYSSMCECKMYNSMWRSQRASTGVRDSSGQLVPEHVSCNLADGALA